MSNLPARRMNNLRILGYLALNTLMAIIGPVVLESPVWHVFPTRSGLDLIVKTWLLSIIFAGLLGTLATRYRTADTAAWAWLIPATLFSYRALAYVFSRHTGLLTHFSGYDCGRGLQKHDCQEFLVFTVPFIRSSFYSAAARLAHCFWSRYE
jgi:hypothetical protein